MLVEKQGDAMLKLIKDQKDQLAKDMQEQLQNAKVIHLCINLCLQVPMYTVPYYQQVDKQTFHQRFCNGYTPENSFGLWDSLTH